jgi:anoctamin-8
MQQYQLHHDSVQEHRDRQLDLCEKEKEKNVTYDSSKTVSSQEDEKSLKEEREAKKTRVKQSLMKRARSVAIFSLKLKVCNNLYIFITKTLLINTN